MYIMEIPVTPEEGSIALSRQMEFFLRASVGNQLFRRWYIASDEKIVDVVQGGNLSCALYVSSILTLLGLLKEPKVHTCIRTLVPALKESDWRETTATLQTGMIIEWAQKRGESGNMHGHVGFVLDEHRAISTNDLLGTPEIHSIHTHKGREPRAYYAHPLLHGAE